MRRYRTINCAVSGLDSSEIGLNGHYALKFGDLLLQDPLNAHLKSHLGHGAAAAGAHQLYLGYAILGHFYQLHIAAVCIERRTDSIQSLLYPLSHFL